MGNAHGELFSEVCEAYPHVSALGKYYFLIPEEPCVIALWYLSGIKFCCVLFAAPASLRSALAPSYIETVRSKLRCLERRVRMCGNIPCDGVLIYL